MLIATFPGNLEICFQFLCELIHHGKKVLHSRAFHTSLAQDQSFIGFMQADIDLQAVSKFGDIPGQNGFHIRFFGKNRCHIEIQILRITVRSDAFCNLIQPVCTQNREGMRLTQSPDEHFGQSLTQPLQILITGLILEKKNSQ